MVTRDNNFEEQVKAIVLQQINQKISAVSLTTSFNDVWQMVIKSSHVYRNMNEDTIANLKAYVRNEFSKQSNAGRRVWAVAENVPIDSIGNGNMHSIVENYPVGIDNVQSIAVAKTDNILTGTGETGKHGSNDSNSVSDYVDQVVLLSWLKIFWSNNEITCCHCL